VQSVIDLAASLFAGADAVPTGPLNNDADAVEDNPPDPSTAAGQGAVRDGVGLPADDRPVREPY
jgi:hypothetical protein